MGLKIGSIMTNWNLWLEQTFGIVFKTSLSTCVESLRAKTNEVKEKQCAKAKKVQHVCKSKAIT